MEGTTIQQALSKNLVIDTAGFIRNAPLQEFGQNLITLTEVTEEIRDKDTKQRLRNLPFQLQFMEPNPESIKFVTDFSKKTGDYASLSATDIKVIALTYMLEIRHIGSDEHLKKEPTMTKSVEFYKPGSDHSQNSNNLAGFYKPDDDEDDEEEEGEEDSGTKEEMLEQEPIEEDMEEINEEEDESDEGIEEDDDEGWITPSNLKAKKLEMLGANGVPEDEDKEIIVACLTNDFAMQNVLKQIGLHVLSADGVIIKVTKTWILRCYSCYATTPKMDKQFCPKCGNKTLKRVSITLNADGSQQIHISTRRPLSTKGKKFSLPAQQGGKYSVNPLMTADQRIPQQKRTALARAKNNVMTDDYVAGSGPFTMHDVNSRSAMLGMGVGQGNHWAQRNPNAVGRKTGNRKKKNRD